jgi:hypothetical protein
MIASLRLLIDRLLAPRHQLLGLCCPGGMRNETVDQLRRMGLRFGRLR